MKHRLLPLQSDEEVEAVETLLNLPKLFAKYELLRKLSFTWGNKKKRSDFPESSSSSHRKVTSSKVVDGADKSPSTPLCFLNSGSDGGDDNKVVVHEEPSLSLKKIFKKKDTDELMVKYKRMLQDNETLKREINTVKNYHQELIAENLELKEKRQKISYSRNIEDLQLWNSPMKVNHEQHYHHQKQQISMFASEQQQHCQRQLMVNPNNVKLMAMSSSSNNNGGGGGRFGLFNQVEPRVKFHGQAYDFMSSSKPLEQSKYMVIDNDLKVRNAADARKRRIMKMKDNKNSLLNLKLSRGSR